MINDVTRPDAPRSDHEIDLVSLRNKAARRSEPVYWRSLDELAETPEFQDLMAREFPHQADQLTDPFTRRSFIKVMGASLALAGVTGCTQKPEHKIVPHVREPADMMAGKPLFFATAMPFLGAAVPVLAESNEGRPTKLEGNPDHPEGGGTDAITQAAILGLYDPDRSKTPLNLGDIRTWPEFLAEIRPLLEAQQLAGGNGLRILTDTVISPSVELQIAKFRETYPGAKWVQYEPAGSGNAREGARLALGEALNVRYHFSRAKRIVSLDADFTASGPGAVRHAREFAAGRRLAEGRTELTRFYAVESMPTPTGSQADHRLPLKPSLIGAFAAALAERTGVSAQTPAAIAQNADAIKFASAVAEDLQAHPGECIVIAGEHMPPAVHALALAINYQLGAFGRTVTFAEPNEAPTPSGHAALKDLAAEIARGDVQLLVIAGCNPVYDAPADIGFNLALLDRVAMRIHLGLYYDETAELCHWHVPQAHFLEAWGDARTADGSAVIVQPLIAPLYGGKSLLELAAVLNGQADRPGYDIVRESWTAALPGVDDFEVFWRKALHDGVIAAGAKAERTATLAGAPPAPAAPAEGIELSLRPDPNVFDGRFANNAWMQELPRPFTKLTWDNAAILSPAQADRLKVRTEDLVDIATPQGTVRLPVYVLAGHADDCITAHLGFGRQRQGWRVADGVGVNLYPIRTTGAADSVPVTSVERTGRKYQLAQTQQHFAIATKDSDLRDRHLVREADLDDYKEHPDFAQHVTHAFPPEYNFLRDAGWNYDEGYKWGMAVDLNACTGCNACITACQAENNIPVVGKDQVRRGREMLWLRVDQYYAGELDNPKCYNQPLPCQQCESAPCETVCPVNATVHSSEGLNDMVYNRCVGTRFCSNNCPYKVRRFNYYAYQDWTTPQFRMLRNPEVTVRSRGVMEKCTYCTQRISAARIQAEVEVRKVRDGDVLTACQSACPTEAIVFGDLNDKESRVAKYHKQPLAYALLEELNTRPRTLYLAKVRNPNPKLEDPTPLGIASHNGKDAGNSAEEKA